MWSITDQTDERSASPDAVGGVSTQAKNRSAAPVSSSASRVKVSRPRFRSTTSAHDHPMAEVGEGGAGHEADPACAEDAQSGLVVLGAHAPDSTCEAV
jgi:hypothetical protein